MSNSKIAEFLAKGNIYSTVGITVEDHQELDRLLDASKRYTFDCYCPECKIDTTFYIYNFESYWEDLKTPKLMITGVAPGGMSNVPRFEKSEEDKYKELIKKNNLFCLTAHCVRSSAHPIWIFIKLEEDKIIKIGQYPNVRLTLYPHVSKYQKLLSNYFIELKTALSLYSNSVGVGSYVYLRRVFEKIIFDKYNESKNEIKISEKDFLLAKMDKKIEMLKDYLPAFIVQNKKIYSILSKGIHELDENECLKYFDTIEQSIEMILDEILEQKSKEVKQKSLTSLIANITGTLRKG